MTKLVLVLSEDAALSDREIFEIDCLFPNDIIAVASPGIGQVPLMMRLTHFPTQEGTFGGIERLLEVMELAAIVMRPGSFFRIRRSIFGAAMSRHTPRLYQFDDTLLEEYRFDQAQKSRVVFIYPGVFAPTSNGSSQRAFNLLMGLLGAGHQVDVVIPYGKGSHNLAVFLKQFGIGVHLFKHGDVHGVLMAARNLSKRVLGLDYYLPYFSRMKFALSSGYRKCLLNVVKPGDKVICTYAWMVPEFIDDQSVDIIVDTHDVNFIRDRGYYGSNSISSRLLQSLNKKLELKALNSAKQIVAISQADREVLQAEGLDDAITLLEPSFDWIDGIQAVDKTAARNFGFIGSNMIANRLAIDEILEEIWPQILQSRPEATLYVAGSICDYLREREGTVQNLIPLGFVASLESFFTKVDALISPIMMQGGLNFKVMESLCCGVPVLVNKGAEHLKTLSPMVFAYGDDYSIEQFLSFADEL